MGRSRWRERGERGKEEGEEGDREGEMRWVYVYRAHAVYGDKFDFLLTTDFMYQEQMN